MGAKLPGLTKQELELCSSGPSLYEAALHIEANSR